MAFFFSKKTITYPFSCGNFPIFASDRSSLTSDRLSLSPFFESSVLHGKTWFEFVVFTLDRADRVDKFFGKVLLVIFGIFSVGTCMVFFQEKCVSQRLSPWIKWIYPAKIYSLFQKVGSFNSINLWSYS